MEDYEAILLKQENGCGCCGTKDPNSGSPKKKNSYFTIDHCHKSNKLRGLLCFKCNSAIGKLGDDSKGIMKAYLYLKQFEDTNV